MKTQQSGVKKPPETSSKGLLEAQNTWNTTKLLGISSSEEDAVTAGLRKSKRLLIIDGKTV